MKLQCHIPSFSKDLSLMTKNAKGKSLELWNCALELLTLLSKNEPSWPSSFLTFLDSKGSSRKLSRFFRESIPLPSSKVSPICSPVLNGAKKGSQQKTAETRILPINHKPPKGKLLENTPKFLVEPRVQLPGVSGIVDVGIGNHPFWGSMLDFGTKCHSWKAKAKMCWKQVTSKITPQDQSFWINLTYFPPRNVLQSHLKNHYPPWN